MIWRWVLLRMGYRVVLLHRIGYYGGLELEFVTLLGEVDFGSVLGLDVHCYH